MSEDTGFLSKQMRPYLVIFSGQAFSLFGSRLVQFALVWYLTAQTGSAQVLATASIAAIIPQVVLAPFAGAFVDRWNRKRVMMVSDSMIAAIVLVLAGLFIVDRVEVWHIYAVMLIRSTGAAFQWPAMQASTSMMVTKENLPRVAGLNQSLQGLVSIVAPPLGAVLLDIVPIEYVIAVDVLTAIMAVGPLMFIVVPQPDRKDLSARGVVSDMREGFRWIWSKKALVHIMLISLSINMVTNPAFSLLPLLVTDYFNGGAIELAWIQSANGLGMILGGLALGVWGGFKSKSLTAFSAMTIAGFGILGFSQTPGTMLWLGIFFVFIFGFMNSIGNSSFMTVLQTIIPHEMQGRVFTLVMATSIAVAPLGLTIAGPVAEMLGVRSWFLVSGFVIVAGALFGLLSKEIRGLDRSFAESEES